MANLNFDYEYHMRDTKFLRNVCILAHVDHGKTTFSDSLIASNGIISSRDVGKVHYLDFREDEQAKQITMKSSCITLLYSSPDFQDEGKCFLINLIDSPGHVDFSAEVKTAVEISDGAFLIIDVVEGICAQTRSVMKQIYLEQLCACLVINKIDKLIVKLKLTPLEAYYHIYHLVEQINALMAGFITFHEFESGKGDKSDDCHKFFFSPIKGNVIFASSLDGWGFSLEYFAQFFADKLGYSKKILAKTLWGDFYISNKVKRVLPNAQAKGKWPLFATLILDTIWSIYQIAFLEKDISRVDILVRKLGLVVHSRDRKTSNFNKRLLQSILTQWLPLSKVALNLAVYQMPGPQNLCTKRIERLLTNFHYPSFSSLPIEVQSLKAHLLACSPDSDVPQIAYISKMMYFSSGNTSPLNFTSKDTFINKSDALITKINIGSAKPAHHSTKDYLVDVLSVSNHLIAITRVFSGTLYKGQYLYVLHPHYDPGDIILDSSSYIIQDEINNAKELPPNVSTFQILKLYILLGGELIEVESVPAGNVCGVSGLDNILLRNGTLSNTLYCIPFTPIFYNTTPILKVALEPVRITDLDALINGINLLAQADPCVQTAIEDSGEHVIYCAGEVHLQKCIEDLSKYFAIGIDFDVSAPIIPYRETIVSNMVNYIEPMAKLSKMKNLTINISDNIYSNCTPNKQFEIALRVCPIPSAIVRFLDANTRLLKLINSLNTQRENAPFHMNNNIYQELTNFKSTLNEIFFSSGNEWINAADKILSFGPKMIGPNILLTNVPEDSKISIWPSIRGNYEHIPLSFDSSIIQGFQLATLQGPLCHEPLVGVCVIIESYKFIGNNNSSFMSREEILPKSELNIPHPSKSIYGPFSGQIISTVIKTCKQALASQPVRLMLAMFSCSIQCSNDVLGSVMAVINRRGGKCFDQSVQVGTNLFSIETYIPVAESLGFSDEIRKKTSGLAIPQLVFSHWEVLNDDPFWIPTTEEELLHFGEKADSENIAKKYVDSIRRRKGLLVKTNIVESAEKQRTVKK
ncbi:Elongation factor-like GTPase 1 [Oopsacas minuta]|uniref:Elongation factor-like 1 n=1 Tax=Oopsacas minuta TaxID=111878 RepID=A0AAV7JU00_9METZ|nr:Elongation factor-like GTPase 1 [Oopsacas minuta]